MGSGAYTRLSDPRTTGVYNCSWGLGVVSGPCDFPSVNAFGDDISLSMRTQLRPPHGAYLDSCFRHCSTNCPNYDVRIGDTDVGHAVALWYRYGSAALPNKGWWEQNRQFPCADCC